jgi:hypothetical protein
MTDLATERAMKPAAVPADDSSPGSRWQRVLASDWTKTFAMAAAFHVVLTAIAVLFQNALPSYQPGNPTNILGNDLTLLSHTFRWDSQHFSGILQGQYTDPATPWKAAFYPLFPATVGLVQAITFGKLGVLAAGFLVNFVASWLAATALLKITRHFVSSTWAPWLAVTAFLTAPTAYFLHAFYSEAIFCALGFWAYRFALRRQWVWMGLCLIPITATRITSVLFIGLCLLEFFRAKEWKLRGLLTWNLLWFPAGFLGFAGYALYLKLATGDALGMFHAYAYGEQWPYHKSNPNFPLTIARELKTSASAFFNSPGAGWEPMVNHLIPMTALAVLLIASGYVFYIHRSAGIPLAAFGVVSIVMFTLNSNLVSVHRYVLPCLVIYIAMATAAERSARLKPVMYGLMFTHAAVLMFLYSLFLSGVWSG